MADVRDSIEKSFDELGVVYNKDIINACVELFLDHGFDEAEDFVDTWMAFSVSRLQGGDPTPQHLSRFKREVLAKLPSHKRANAETPSTYGNTPQNSAATPDANRRGRLESPRGAFSPASFSPSTRTPSAKYSSRHNAGSVLCEKAGTGSDSVEKPDAATVCSMTENPDERHMSFSLADFAEVAEKNIEHLVAELSQRFSLEELAPVNAKYPTAVTVAGRVACDADGKLNAESTLLEASPDSGGEAVRLDLSSLQAYSIFPGQVIAVEGLNITGKKFVAQKIWYDATINVPPSAVNLAGSLKLIVACGPFTTSDSLTYQPLIDLMAVVKKEEPHLLLLTGPFIDSQHPSIKEHLMAESYQEFFARLCDQILNPLKGLRTKVALVSSHRDCHGAAVFPTPSYKMMQEPTNLILLPDPCVVDVDGVHVAVTSVDVLMHLGKEEVAWPSHSGDRLARLASHVLQQQSFYPLRPPPLELPLNPRNEDHLKIKKTPHILILPSDLRCFIKEVNNCAIVNPERLAKGLVGGSFAKLVIASNGSVSGQVIKI